MFKLAIICILLATTFAQDYDQDHHSESGDEVHAEIKHLDVDVHQHGFQYAFETTNHIKAVAEGDEHGNAHGSFQWISPKGEHIEVNYVADENGYQPQSDILPTPPPTPEAILRALKYIEEHPLDHQEVLFGHRF